MPEIANPTLFAVGIAAFVVGYLCVRWAGRNSIVDQTKDVLWDAVKARDSGVVRQHVEGRIADVTGEASHTGRVRKVAGFALRETLARVFGLVGWIALLAGLAIAAAGLFWN